MKVKRSNYNKFANKLIVVLVLALVLTACLFVVAACKKHNHEYTSEVTKDPTCTESGVETFTCECGDSYTQAVLALGHSYTALDKNDNSHWNVCVRCSEAQPNSNPTEHEYTVLVEDAGTPATCTTQGKEVYKCVCGATKETTLPTENHALSYQSDEKEHWQECANCNFATAKVEHNHTTVLSETPATCTEDGVSVKECVCKHTEKVTVSSSGHQLQYKFNDNKHWQKCDNCEYKTSEVDHEYASGVTRQPTCTAEGETTYLCECKRSYTEPINKKAHDFTEIVNTSANHWTVCSVCEAVDPEHPKMAHEWTITGVKQAATCTAGGYNYVQCSVCEYESTQPSNKLNHDFENAVLGEFNANGHRLKCARCEEFVFVNHNSLSADLIGDDAQCPDGHNKAATCGQNGHQDKICLVCQQAFHTVVPATGEHDYSDGWVNTHGTQHWHVCAVCGGEDARVNHTWTTVTEASTCTEIGHERSVCSECGYQRSNKNIPALGHDTEETVNVDATCQHAGEKTVTCSRCDYSEVVEIAQLKHDWHGDYEYDDNKHYRTCASCGIRQESGGNHNLRSEVIQQATNCGDERITRKTCTANCGYTVDIVEIKAHSWVTTDDGRIDPTCGAAGGHYEYCNNAGCTEPQKWVIDPQLSTGHNLVYHERQEATLFEDGNVAYHECLICGRYFQTKNCETEYTAQEIVIPKPERVSVSSIADLWAIVEADDNYPEDTPSAEYYEITLQLFEKNTGSSGLEFVDDAMEGSITVYFDSIENLYNLSDGDEVTLIGNLVFTSDADVELRNARCVRSAGRRFCYALHH